MKKCPYCAEEIQDEAIVCKHCGRDLKPATPPAPPAQPTVAPKKRSLPRTIFGCLVLVLCSLCAVGFGISRSGSTNTAVDVTQAPTVADVVQATPNSPPTRTPSPTDTSVPEAEIDPYFIAMQERFSEFQDAYLVTNDYVQQAGNDPTLIFDDDWKTRTGLALGLLTVRADAMAALEPSPKFETFHNYIVELAKETHLFADNYANGIDNFDSEAIRVSSEHLTKMSEIMQDATAELTRIKNQ